MMSASEFILNFLLNSAWQIPAICLIAALGTCLLKNCSAHYRYTVWIVALVCCLIAPLITATQVVPTSTINPRPNSVTSTEDEVPIDHTRRRRSSQVVVTPTPQNIQLVTSGYLLFLGFATLRFVRLWIAKERLRRSASFDGLSSQMEIALNRCRTVFRIEKVRLARSSTARVPYTLGIRRPLIVLPDSFCGDVEEETLLSVIGHEMAHVRRKDLLAKLACELVSLPIAFHPITFVIKRRIERERELACDELVSRRVLRPETYARSLLRAADLSILPARRGVMLSVFDGPMLEERIRQLTRKRLPFNAWSGRMITACVLCALCVLSVVGSAFGFSFGPQKGTNDTSLVAPVVDLSHQPSVISSTQDPSPVAPPRRNSTASQDAQQLARTACEAGQKKDLNAIPSLIAMLADDRKTEPLACWTNGRWSPALDTFKHPSPGEEAALALASMGRDAFVPLMNQLNSSNAATRRNAAWAIGELTGMIPGERASAVPELIPLLLSDTDAWVRMAAARALGEVRDRRASPTLTATLGDSDWRVRRLAAWALNEMKEEQAVPALCDLLLRDSRVEVRVAAAEALGEIRSAVALFALERALNDADEGVRAKAKWAIAEIDG